MRESIIKKKTFADLVSAFFYPQRGSTCRIIVGKARHENNMRN